MNEKTRRDILTEAMDGDADDTTEVTSSGSEPAIPNDGHVEEPAQISADDQSSTEKSGEKEPKIKWTGEKDKKPDPYSKEKVAADKTDPNAPKKQGEKDATADKSATDQTQQDLKAPNSWKPAAREEWAKIPKTAQAEITRRERQIQQTLSETANIRKFSNDLANVIAPHTHLIRAQGSTPLKAIDNLMRTSAGLATLRGRQQANIVAQICRNFSVDVKELDAALAEVLGQGGGEPQQNGGVDVHTAVAEAMRPFSAFMGTVQQQTQAREAEIQQNAQVSVEDFINDPKNEFAMDLSDEMADIMEMKAARGQKVTIQQAYQMAIRNNPDVEAIVNQRKAATRVQSGSNVSRARRAASTIHGSPSGNAGGDKGGAKSRREILSEAMSAGNQ